MSYNFKSLADVELLSSMPENANVIVEVDGTTRRASLASVETLMETPEEVNVLIEIDGEIKKIPSNKLISNDNVKPIIFTGDYSTGNCSCNVSYTEAKEAFLAGVGASCFNNGRNAICTNMSVYFNDDASMEIIFSEANSNWSVAFQYRPTNELLMMG